MDDLHPEGPPPPTGLRELLAHLRQAIPVAGRPGPDLAALDPYLSRPLREVPFLPDVRRAVARAGLRTFGEVVGLGPHGLPYRCDQPEEVWRAVCTALEGVVPGALRPSLDFLLESMEDPAWL